MAKKKIVKLTDEQYFKYIMSLKNENIVKNVEGDTVVPDSLKNAEKNKTE